jgi:sugar O-acyltransferase (sialic acid O-acetyltransferase NeuD family)
MYASDNAAGENMHTRRAILTMPRLNANEDEARVVVLPLAEGQMFEAGALLFTVETTKAANDVIAPCCGKFGRLLVAVDDLVPVGGAICEVELEPGGASGDLDLVWADVERSQDCSPEDEERHISAKARERARELGIDIEDVQAVGGRVRVADVDRHGAALGQVATKAAGPAILHLFAPADAVIIGGSGHARAVLDALTGSGFRPVGAIDDALPVGTRVIHELQVLGTAALLHDLRERGLRNVFIGVGGATSNTARRTVFELAVATGFSLPPLVARNARLGLGSTLGAASYCFPGANVGSAVKIGSNCIINQNVVVCHDSVIEDGVHLAPNAVVAGHCHVGSGSTIGMCATLINGCRVGSNCLVHNNVPVASDVADGTTVTLVATLGKLPGPHFR